MILKVIPVACPQIDWIPFLESLKMLDRSPARRLDMARMEVGTPESYLAILAYLQNPNGPPPNVILKNLGRVMDHLFYSFVIIGSRSLICEISMRSHLRLVSAENSQPCESEGESFTIVSGTLSQWYAAILEFCSSSASQDLRRLHDAIMLYFEKIGLKAIWHNYRKLPQQDETFILEEKKNG